MKVLLIDPNIESGMSVNINIGITSISAVLKQAGHSTFGIQLSQRMTKEEFQHAVLEIDPDLVGFSSTTHQWQFVKQYGKWVREATKATTVCGGYHVTLCPEEVFAEPNLDWIVRGEGEETIVELVEALEQGRSPDNIPNVWGGPNQVSNPVRPPIPDLDTLPYLDHDVYDMDAYLKGMSGILEHVTGRGCPYSCTYCCNPQWNEIYRGKGNVVRRQSPERAIAELEYLVDEYHPRGFQFRDEIFIMSRQWILDFCQKYKERVNIPFEALLRVNMATDEIMTALADSGCRIVCVGVEAGNEQYRQEVLNRKMSDDDIRRVFYKADELGMSTLALIMIGLPKQTPALLQDTINLVRDIGPDHVQASIFHPYPKTPLYELCAQEGYLTGRVETTYFSKKSVLVQPQLPDAVIQETRRALRDIDLDGKVRKQKIGLYDFIINLDQAKKRAGHPEYIQPTVYGEYNDAVVTLNAHPHSTISYKLVIPENAVLRTALGLNPEIWNKQEGDAVRFKITLKGRGKKHELLSESINPKFNVEDQKWHPVELPLQEWAGEKVVLSFITEPDPASNAFSWAGWARPHLAHPEDPKPWFLRDRYFG